MKKEESLLTIPQNVALNILKGNGIVACPLLSTDKFVKFSKERDLAVDKERLLRFERLGLFSPLLRIRTPHKKDASPLILPLGKDDKWFKEGWAWDTTTLSRNYEVPDPKNREHEAYYSAFQIFHLEIVLSAMNFSLHMDSFLDHEKEVDWNRNAKNWMKFSKSDLENLSEHEFRRAVALLCQYVSDRYYPETQSDQRTIQVPQGWVNIDRLINHHALDWKWWGYSKNWNPKKAETLFRLTPEKLKHAYRALSVSQASLDPLERWYQLVQFVDLRERKQLKGSALCAETLRSGALMLRLLYKDLYREKLPPPNEMIGQVITHIPEQEIRADSRRYLEFVSNRYHLKPQPKLVLFVEGQTEEATIKTIFEQYIGAHPGKYAIEIVCLHGVDTATGSKDDRFRAILRLVDYLHHHQTFTFLILDNEGYARKLKAEARKAKSKHHKKRFITRPEYIKIWKESFEFDNYSCTEIALAMEQIAQGYSKFSRAEVMACKKNKNPGAALSTLYKQKTSYGLNKGRLNEALIEAALSSKTKKNFSDRPIIKTLERVEKLALRNPLPTMLEVWEKNQSSRYLGEKRK